MRLKLTSMLTVAISLITLILIFSAKAQVVSCPNVSTIRVDSNSSWSAEWNGETVRCLQIASNSAFMNVELEVNRGTVSVYFKEDNQWANNGTFPVNIELNKDLTPVSSFEYSGEIALVPSSTANYYLTLFVNGGETTAESDAIAVASLQDQSDQCYRDPNCDSSTPIGDQDRIISLERVGDVAVIPFDVCRGETQITVSGLLNRGDVRLHILPPTSPVPNTNTQQSRRPAWNPETYKMYTFRQFSNSDSQVNPVQLLYVVRTGTPIVRGVQVPVRAEVSIRRHCGLFPLESGASEGSVRQSASSGSQRGGVDVATYCRSFETHLIARNGVNSRWVCYDAGNILDNGGGYVYFAINQFHWDAMCVNHYGRDAYAVRDASTNSINCYK